MCVLFPKYIDEINVLLPVFQEGCSKTALESPSCSVVIGDLDAKCNNCWTGGTNNYIGLELYNLSTLL